MPGQSYDNSSNQKYVYVYFGNSKLNPIIGFIDAKLGISVWRYISHMKGSNKIWSITNPGRITLYEGEYEVSNYSDSVQEYKSIIAHEFAHTLGISDAYKRPGSEAAKKTLEVPNNDIMRTRGGTINANTIEMILEAWSTNQWQCFDGNNKYSKSKVLKLI